MASMATAKLKRKNPDSQKSSLIKLLILKKCSFVTASVRTRMLVNLPHWPNPEKPCIRLTRPYSPNCN